MPPLYQVLLKSFDQCFYARANILDILHSCSPPSLAFDSIDLIGPPTLFLGIVFRKNPTSISHGKIEYQSIYLYFRGFPRKRWVLNCDLQMPNMTWALRLHFWNLRGVACYRPHEDNSWRSLLWLRSDICYPFRLIRESIVFDIWGDCSWSECK